MAFNGFMHASSSLSNLAASDKRGLCSQKSPGHDDAPITRNKTTMRDGGVKAPGLGLLCPFYVKDKNTWHKCLERSLRHPSDVQTHIERVHMQSYYCPTCDTTFVGDEFDEAFEKHIGTGECLGVLLCRPGVSKEQLRRLKDTTHDKKKGDSAARWTRMWKIIFPNEEVRDCPFASGEPSFVRRLVDIRDIINSGHWQRLVPEADFGKLQPQVSIIDQFIDAAKLLEELPDGLISTSDSMRTLSAILAPVPGGNSPSPSSSSTPQGNQTSSRSTPILPADTPAQWEVDGVLLKMDPDSQNPCGSSTHLDVDQEPPLLNDFQDGQFQTFEDYLTESLAIKDQSPAPLDVADEHLAGFSSGSNQLITDQEPHAVGPLDGMYLVDPWNPEYPI